MQPIGYSVDLKLTLRLLSQLRLRPLMGPIKRNMGIICCDTCRGTTGFTPPIYRLIPMQYAH